MIFNNSKKKRRSSLAGSLLGPSASTENHTNMTLSLIEEDPQTRQETVQEVSRDLWPYSLSVEEEIGVTTRNGKNAELGIFSVS
jgi:hypothetical protein